MLLKITGFYSCFCPKVSTQYKENPFNLTKYAIWWFLPSPFSVLGCKKRCDLNEKSDTYCTRPMLTKILKMKWEWKVHQVHWAFQVFPLRYEFCYSLGCCEAKSINICKVLVCNLVNIHEKSTWEQIILSSDNVWTACNEEFAEPKQSFFKHHWRASSKWIPLFCIRNKAGLAGKKFNA